MPYVFSCQNHRRAEGPEFSFKMKKNGSYEKLSHIQKSLLPSASVYLFRLFIPIFIFTFQINSALKKLSTKFDVIRAYLIS